MIKEYLEKYLLADRAEHDKRERSGKMNPSKFGQCFLRQYRNRRNDPASDPVTIDVLKTFFAGNIIEEIITSKIPKEFKQIVVEEEDVKGVLDFSLEGENEICEVKSMNSWVFKKKLPHEAMIQDLFEMVPQYVLQSTYYALKKGKKFVRLIFVSKNLDKLEIKEYVWETERFRKEVEAEIEANRGFWKDQSPPPPNPRLFDKKECQYCEFQTDCKGKPF